MPIFHCKVVDKAGKASEFVRDAVSEELLLRELGRNDIFPIEVRETEERTLKTTRRKKLKRASILEFTNTMALLLSSGLTFKDALKIGQTIFLKGEVNAIIVVLLEKIVKGNSVYQALEDISSNIPPIFKGFIKIGEKIGSLEDAFKQLSEYLSEERKIRDKLISSLIYPILVLSVAVLGITGIVIFLFPRIEEIFSQLGSGLPQRFESMMQLLNFSTISGGIVIGLACLGIFSLMILKRNNTYLSDKIDRLFLKIPVIGKISYLKEMLNLLFAMETLTGGGFTVEDALLESSVVLKNRAFQSGVLKARESIIKGGNLSTAFLENSIFSERLGRWIAIGERSGRVDQVFAQLRSYYQGEIEKWSSRFMNLIEPILILLVGVIIFIIIIFFIIPIFSIYEGFV